MHMTYYGTATGNFISLQMALRQVEIHQLQLWVLSGLMAHLIMAPQFLL